MAAPNSGPIDLNNKNAVIVGGGGDIGSAVCSVLAREGANIIVVDIDKNGMERVKTELESRGKKAVAVHCDVTKEEQVNSCVDSIKKEHGSIDIFVYGSGIMTPTHLEEISLEEWNKVIAVNLTGAFLFCRKVLPIMKKQKGGKIILFGSVAAKIGGVKSGIHYVATKAALHGMAKWMARDSAPYGVCVNSIAPGPVATKMTKELNIPPESFPLGRLGTTEDIAEAVLYLSSDASNWITGTVFDINGGQLME